VPMIELRGITWDHPRGMAPMRATAAAYEREHPEVRITWEARTLQAFGDQPIEDLTMRYDLLIIDHPFVGRAAPGRLLLPLDEHLPASFLAEQAAQSVGRSHESYQYDGHQWALTVDAAAQVVAYRPDLLAQLGREVPQTWDEVLALVRSSDGRRVAIPLTPVNAICSFLSLCAILGDPPGADPTRLVGRATGTRALAILRELVAHGHPAALTLDPPRLLDLMVSTDEVIYCPLLFGYSNYSRPAYAPRRCRFANIPMPAAAAPPAGAILGGAGLAIAAHCQAPTVACDYAQWVASADCQRTLYVESGGQPGNRMAWTDPAVNAATGNFFLDTLETLSLAYLRPRHEGFIAFQDQAGPLLHDYLGDGGMDDTLLDQLDILFRAGFRAGRNSAAK
jgi:multiple sugar transport system substrate-binding protein